MENIELNAWGEFRCPEKEQEFQQFYWDNKKTYFLVSYLICTILFTLHGFFDFKRTFIMGDPSLLMALRFLFLGLCIYFVFRYKRSLTVPKHLYEFSFFLKMFSVFIILLLTLFTSGLSLTLHIGSMIMIASFYICLPARPLYALISSLSISAIFIFGASSTQEGMVMHILKSFILIASNVILWFYCLASQKFQRLEFISSQNLKTIADMKGKFLTTLAHDLRTPLTIIAGRNRLMQKKMEKKDELDIEKMQNYTNSISDNIKTINDMIEGLIHWTISKDEYILNEKPLEQMRINQTINNAIHFVDEMAQNKKTQIICELCEDELQHDPIMIETIIRNLLNNAIKFSPENSTIKIKTYLDEKFHIEIYDNANLLSSEDIKKIELGGAIASRLGTKNEKGTGLGLKLIHSFLKVQNGKLKVSHHDAGNVFKLELPRA